MEELTLVVRGLEGGLFDDRRHRTEDNRLFSGNALAALIRLEREPVSG